MIDKPTVSAPAAAGATPPPLVWHRQDRLTWAAEAAGAVLHASRGAYGWRGAVAWIAPGVRAERFSDPLPTRRQAQAWAERTAATR